MSQPFVQVIDQLITFTNFQVNFHVYDENPPQGKEETSNTGHETAANTQDLQKQDQKSVKKKGKSKDNHRRIAQRILKLLQTNKNFHKDDSVYKYFLNKKEIANAKEKKMSKDECRKHYGYKIDPNTVSRHQVMTYLYSIPKLKKQIVKMFQNGKMKRQIQLSERQKKTIDDHHQSNSTTKIQICQFVAVAQLNQIEEARNEDGQNIEEQNRDEGNPYLSENSMVAQVLSQQRNQKQCQQIFQKQRESQQSQELLLPASLKGANRKEERDSN